MHIPDGFLSLPVAAGTTALSGAALGAALRRVRPECDPALAPRMGVTAAYVFAAQMVNFPVAPGTSGHLLGAALAAILVGPAPAVVVMTAVFLVQTFLFADGGYSALGANVLNMGVAGVCVGHCAYRALAGPLPGPRRAAGAAAAAAWLAVMTGAALTAGQLALSGTVAAGRVFGPMLAIHALIGAGEAAISGAAVGLLARVRPDLITGSSPRGDRRPRWSWAAGGGLLAAAALAPFASAAPDGLERAALSLGFAARAAAPPLPGVLPDYALPGLEGAAAAPFLVSLLGSGLMAGSLALLYRARPVRAAGASHPARTDARVRLACLLGLALTAAFLPASEAGKLLLLAGVAAAWAALSRARARWLLGRALLLLPFAGLAALSIPWVRGASGPSPGFYEVILLRAAVSLLAAAAFAASTSEPEFLRALRAFRVPRPLAETVAFGLRYAGIVGEEAARMLQARAARGGRGTPALRARAAGGIVGSLFIRSFERAERVSLAMAARGYRGLPPLPEARLSLPDGLMAGGMALFLLGIWLWR